MNPLKPHQYYPHALLLIGASVCIALVLLGPTQTRTHQSLSESQDAASAKTQQSFDDNDYSHTYANSLADLLREARRKVVRMRMMNKSKQAEQTAEQQRVSLDQATPQHRMVRRFDPRNMLDVNPFTPVVHEDYAIVSNPLAWRRPDALPPREYTVLGYGEVGNEQLNETQPLDEPSPSAPATTTTSIADADTQTVIVSQTVTPTASLSTSPRADAAVAMPVQASQASRPVPVQSASVQPAMAQSLVVRPASAQPITQPITQATAAAPAKTIQTQIAPLPTRATSQATVSLSRDSAPAASTKAPAAQPTASPRPVAVAAKTPTRSATPAAPAVAKSKAAPSTPTHPSQPATAANFNTPQNNPTSPLVLYVEDHEEIGRDKLNAIRNAISRINQDTDLPVRLEMTTDPSRAYDIRFREDAGTDMGNKLGVTTLAYTQDNYGNQTYLRPGSHPAIDIPEITLNSAFNWFAGEDEYEIDDDEYDYETTFLHESLHVLGLGDGYDNPQAASHGTLAPGITRRDLDEHDQHELAELYENFNPWQNQTVATNQGRANTFNIRHKSQALTALVPEPVSALVVGMGVLVGMMRRRR